MSKRDVYRRLKFHFVPKYTLSIKKVSSIIPEIDTIVLPQAKCRYLHTTSYVTTIILRVTGEKAVPPQYSDVKSRVFG
jgi:hypothetical protein